MTRTYFNNINGYAEDGFTHFIPESARRSCREAWLFAREHGYPLNQHIHIDLLHISPEDTKVAYRYFVNKCRTYATDNGFTAVMVVVRECDSETNLNPRIDILFHVPDCHQSHFKQLVSGWRCEPQVHTVNYDEVIGPDGIKHSIFNDLFAATSRQFGLNHPDLPRRSSGEIMGHRTFYSRHLWTKKQIEFRRKKQAPF